jgi:hypothetical protein
MTVRRFPQRLEAAVLPVVTSAATHLPPHDPDGIFGTARHTT